MDGKHGLEYVSMHNCDPLQYASRKQRLDKKQYIVDESNVSLLEDEIQRYGREYRMSENDQVKLLELFF